MPNTSHGVMDTIFHPRSIALAGITIAHPEHWTRTFLQSLLEFRYPGELYLVNPRGGEINGLKVYRSFAEIPHDVDYVISTVPAKASAGLVDECTGKGVKAVHFCTAGFSETGEPEGVRLEAQLAEAARRTGIRVIGPNCMGVYCPKSRLSFQENFPREGGTVGFLSQSGGNSTNLIRRVAARGVRFSKVVSYGNACDLDESDFLEYIAADADTSIIAIYIEGVKNGKKFRQALQSAARDKAVVLLKGGITEGGARAAAGHTGSLSGSETTWDALCKQLGVIRVHSIEDMADTLVTLRFMPPPRGRRAALIGAGGGASVLITDDFEKRGLAVPPLPPEIRDSLRQFTPAAGNILRNPVDYSQTMVDMEKVLKTVKIIARWEGIDFIIGFLSLSWAPVYVKELIPDLVKGMLAESRAANKPLAMVIEAASAPEEITENFSFVQNCTAIGLPVYHSFASAANAINLVLSYHERRNT